MVNITVKTSSINKRDSFEPSVTPNEVFESFGIGLGGTVVRLDGAIIGARDLDKSLAELGVADGASATLSAIVKADGANR